MENACSYCFYGEKEEKKQKIKIIMTLYRLISGCINLTEFNNHKLWFGTTVLWTIAAREQCIHEYIT